MSLDAVIDVLNFTKSFGDKTVHKDVSFYVKKGECLGLLGGSGAGKSVILRSLIGLESPDSGQILIDRKDVTKFNERELVELRKRVAYVFQNGALFDSMSVFDNLAYSLREHTKLTESEIAYKVNELLTEFGLEGNEKLYPAELSGGMQKRVGLARSIIMNPDIVLYDEPTAGLDPYNTKRIQEMILRLKTKGVTSVLVTHDIPSAFAVCDKIAVLLHGVILSQGTREQLAAEPGSLIFQFINGEEV